MQVSASALRHRPYATSARSDLSIIECRKTTQMKTTQIGAQVHECHAAYVDITACRLRHNVAADTAAQT